ncbi:MAG: hypothetical protein AAFX65_09735 [Cyanobacteria bacterium J06638_7]
MVVVTELRCWALDGENQGIGVAITVKYSTYRYARLLPVILGILAYALWRALMAYDAIFGYPLVLMLLVLPALITAHFTIVSNGYCPACTMPFGREMSRSCVRCGHVFSRDDSVSRT